jgi:hypothetical protein
MSPEPIRIKREELYALVWSRTLRRISEELGTSYVELVKACNAMNVPRPLPGHWEAVRLGQAVEQVPLPEVQPGGAVECSLRPRGTVSEREVPRLLQTPKTERAEPQKPEPGAGIGQTVAEPVRNRFPVTVTRQELYEKVWQMSLKRLAEEWGTSYLQLVAACELMNVPRPPSGHWVRLSLGHVVGQIPLPEAGPDTPVEVTLEPMLSRAERAAKAAEKGRTEATEAQANRSGEGAGAEGQAEAAAGGELQSGEGKGNVLPATTSGIGRVELPPEGAGLHPIAERHLQGLQNGKPGELGFISVRGPDLFWCDLTPALVPKLGRAMHALIGELEARGYGFRNGENNEEGLGIVRGEDRAEIRWSEGKIELEREPTNVDKRKPSWTWNLKETKPTGELVIEVNAGGLKGKRKWSEGEARPVEQILWAAVEKVDAVFRGFEGQRKREVELARQHEEAEKRRLEEGARESERQAKLEEERKAFERVRRHEAKLEQIAELRRQNLLVAAKLWIQSRGVAAYVAYCEATWRVTAGEALTQAQAEWLAWARAEAARMGPFGKGYPVPERDGMLDVSTIRVGGPYPEPKELEGLEEVAPKAPVLEPEVRYVEVQRQPEQFPFWLQHRRH